MSLLDPNTTLQSLEVTTLVPGRTTPNAVRLVVAGLQFPPGESAGSVLRYVALGTEAETVTDDEAAVDVPPLAAITAPHAIAMTVVTIRRGVVAGLDIGCDRLEDDWCCVDCGGLVGSRFEAEADVGGCISYAGSR